jgi:neutrophil cytosolic factor 2
MAEFYNDYLGSYDQGNSVPVISPHRAGAWSKLHHASESDSRSAPNSLYSHNGRSMRRKNSSRANPRAYTRALNNYEEEGYGSEEYDDGPLELTMIRVKVCSISFIHFVE